MCLTDEERYWFRRKLSPMSFFFNNLILSEKRSNKFLRWVLFDARAEVQIWPKAWQCMMYPSLPQNENSHNLPHSRSSNKLNFSLIITASNYENEDVSMFKLIQDKLEKKGISLRFLPTCCNKTSFLVTGGRVARCVWIFILSQCIILKLRNLATPTQTKNKTRLNSRPLSPTRSPICQHPNWGEGLCNRGEKLAPSTEMTSSNEWRLPS